MHYLIFIMLAVSLGYFATDIYLPSLPAIVVYFKTSEVHVQFTIVAYLLSFAISPLFFGPISDRVGRRKIILLGLVSSILATIFCLTAQNIYWLIIARFIQGMGIGAVVIAGRAMVADLYTGKELARTISYITMLMPVVLALAPTLGGILQELFNWQVVFIFLLCYLITIIGLMLLLPKVPQKEKWQSNIITGYKQLIANNNILRYGLCSAIPSFGIFSYLTASPFLFQNIVGLSPAEYGSLAIFIGIAISIVAFLNINLVKYLQLTIIVKSGALISLAAGVIMLSCDMLNIVNVYAILLPSIMFIISIPLITANCVAMVLSYTDPKLAGSASALMTTTQFMMGVLGSLLFSCIPETSSAPLAYSYVGCAVVLMLLLRNK